MKNKSYWISSTVKTKYPKFKKNIYSEITVVGGGIAGLMSAYFLQNAGYNVVLLEKGKIIEGVSGNTTAKITSYHGPIYNELIEKIGLKKAKLHFEANQDAIKKIGLIVKKEKIKCDFEKKDLIIYSETSEGLENLKSEMRALKKMKAPVEFLKKTEIGNGGIKIKNQAQFHPRQFLLKIAEIFIKKGGKIFENTFVTALEEDKKVLRLRIGRKFIETKYAIIASHFPFYDPAMYFSKLIPKSAYGIAVKVKNKIPKNMYVSIEEGGITIRNHKNILIIGGEDHRTGHQKTDPYSNLIKKTNKYFNIESVENAWSTHDLVTLDNLPYVGKIAKDKNNILVITGFGEWGMTKSILSGEIIRDIIKKRRNPLAELYYPSRPKLSKSLGKFLKNNFHVAKDFFGDRLKVTKEKRKDIPLEEGKIIEMNNKKWAVYKDKNNNIKILEPYCTHMGCMVHWNSSDKTWDCPCHGSRFDLNGKVLYGPALKNLKKG